MSRLIAARNEQVALYSVDRRVDLTAQGPLVGLADIQGSTGFDVVVSSTAGWNRQFAERDDDTRLEPSIDVFYRWTTSLTSALTVNTDFSAAEVDQRELNLTRFDLFFPEKRDFFLQDTNLFEFGGIEENGLPFFSRRVGLDSDGRPLDLRIGGKLTGRAGRWAIGTLALEQDTEIPGETASLAVSRIQASLGDQMAVGGIFTYGDPLTGADDVLWGFDYRFQAEELFGDQELEAFVWLQNLDSDARGIEDDAFGITLAWPNDAIDALVSITDIGDDFEPPIGFVNRTGIRDYLLETTFRVRPNQLPIRIWDIGVEANWVDDQSGQLESRVFEFKPIDLRNHAGDQFEIGLIRIYERLDAPFEVVDGLDVNPGQYNFDRIALEVSTAEQRAWRTEFKYETGDFFDGKLDTVELSLGYQPSSYLEFGLDYEDNNLRFPEGDTTLRLLRLSADLSFNAQWSWTNLLQYDSESQELGFNSRVRFIPRAGRSAYLVINHGILRDQFDRFRSVESDVSVKFSYTLRF